MVNSLDKLLKNRDKVEATIARLREEAREEEEAVIKSSGKNPLSLIKFFPKQEIFFKDNTTIRIITGGNSSGKTFTASVETVFLLTKTHPYKPEWNKKTKPVHGMLVVEDARQATQHGASQSKLLSMIPEEKIKKKKFDRNILDTIWLNDGSSIVMRSAKAGRASLQGSRLDFVWVDENCIKDADFYDELLFRISDSGEVPLIIISATPNLDPAKDQFMDEVLLPRAEDDEKKYDIKVHQISLFDNPYVSDKTKQFLMKNSAGSADQLRARFEGDYKKKHGIIYNFHKDIHIIQPINNAYIKEHCRAIFRVIDPHPVKPIAVSFIGCFDDGRVIQFNELFFDGLVSDVAKKIKMICDGLGHLIAKTILDFAGNAKTRMGKGNSVRDEFLEYGISCANCVKDVTLGINFVREMLQFTDEINPTLYVTSNCINTIREFGKYREDLKTGLPVKKNDEFMDNLRYFACDKDAQVYFLKREKRNVRNGQRVINESTKPSPFEGTNSEKLKRIRARQSRNASLVGRGVGRRR
jgi:hypothetical protein